MAEKNQILTKKEQWANKAIKHLELAEKNEAQMKALCEQQRKILDSIPVGQPILRDHYSAPKTIRTQTKLQNMSDKIMQLHESAEEHRSKAKNLEIMATTNKGDAKSRQDRQCEAFMNKVNIGDKVYSIMDRQYVTIIKKNKKTVGILLENGTSYPIEPFMLELRKSE